MRALRSKIRAFKPVFPLNCDRHYPVEFCPQTGLATPHAGRPALRTRHARGAERPALPGAKRAGRVDVAGSLPAGDAGSAGLFFLPYPFAFVAGKVCFPGHGPATTYRKEPHT